jgi:hypothetical protein
LTAIPFELQPTPSPFGLAAVKWDSFTTLLATGISNPFGPMLNVIGLEDWPIGEHDVSILHLMLNPFEQGCELIGHTTRGDAWDPEEVLPKFFKYQASSCPTLLLPTAFLEPDGALRVHTKLLQACPDGANVLPIVKEFRGNAVRRIDHQAGQVPDLMRALRSGTRAERAPRALAEADGKELASILLRPGTIMDELRGFMFAWNGAIKFQQDMGTQLAHQGLMTAAEFLIVLESILATCRVVDAGS